MILCPWLTLEIKARPGCELTARLGLPHEYWDTLSTVHLSILKIGFGQTFNVLGSLSKTSFFLLGLCEKEELIPALFAVEMYRLLGLLWSLRAKET